MSEVNLCKMTPKETEREFRRWVAEATAQAARDHRAAIAWLRERLPADIDHDAVLTVLRDALDASEPQPGVDAQSIRDRRAALRAIRAGLARLRRVEDSRLSMRGMIAKLEDTLRQAEMVANWIERAASRKGRGRPSLPARAAAMRKLRAIGLSKAGADELLGEFARLRGAYPSSIRE